jgi:hypothetical protein
MAFLMPDGHDASQNVAKSVLAEENFCSMLKWKT